MNGFTSDEAFLNRLGERSFLRFWSWPNLFRDQGDANRSGDGKEICDLTIIFGNDIILFSDKRIEFNTEKPANIAWSRWARRAIGDSVKQIKGARRWIKTYPERIFLDKKCTQKVPLEIPLGHLLRFHNVVVCHGVEESLKSFNDEASFFFDNTIKGSDHWDGEKCRPFHIGQIFEGDFVHIFNESTIELVLNEFDTTKDFTEYLLQRESLLSSEKAVMINSEADIIQLYYESFDPELGERVILSGELSKADCLIVEKGGIADLYSNHSYLAKKAADKISYFWDGMIECFSFHILNGSSEHKSWDHPNEIEPSVRHMAETGRFVRRVLATHFIGFYEKAIPGQRGTRLFIEPFSNDSAYLFMVLPFQNMNLSHEKYRDIRRCMLHDYCVINKFLNQGLKKIVGIACKTRDTPHPISPLFFNEGQDFIFMDFQEFSAEDMAEAEELYNKYVSNGLLAERKEFRNNSNEFPSPPLFTEKNLETKGRDRNKPCICGSGKKLKKCCGSA